MPDESSLPSRLAAVLPAGLSLQVYHLSTSPTSVSALFAPLPGHEEEITSCESHFLAVSSPQHDDHKEVLIYAIEVLIFTTKSLTTLFISKADSSGFSPRLNQPKGSPSIVAAITSTFVEYLLEPRLNSLRVVLSLFARSQKQYLFPGSSENPGKHILDDRQLIRWWCRVLDKILRLSGDDSTATAHLLVPGCDKGESKAFFPPSSRADPPAAPKWINSYPVELLVANPSFPPRHLVPRLPDDPKARFLDDLDGDFVDERGNWRSVKTLGQFWEFMSYRQECSSGRLVGFLWVIFSRGQTKHASLSELRQTNQVQKLSKPMAQSRLPTPGNSQQLDNGGTVSEPPTAPNLEMIQELNSPPPSSPIQEDSAPGTSQTVGRGGDSSAAHLPVEDILFPAVGETQGQIILDDSQYQAVMDHLLQTDFAGEDPGAEATKSWRDKVLETSKVVSFGRPVLGCATPVLARTPAAADALSAQVNVLTGIRKKRKADAVDHTPNVANAATVASINTLSSGLVRKKPKS